MRSRTGAGVILVAFCLPAAGCGGDPSVEVTGTVTFDGRPLAEGEVIFAAEDGGVTPAAAKVQGGRYALRSLPGPKKVMINASRRSPVRDSLTGEYQEYSFILPVYNLQSKLTANVRPGQSNTFDFELKSKP